MYNAPEFWNVNGNCTDEFSSKMNEYTKGSEALQTCHLPLLSLFLPQAKMLHLEVEP